jgi:hypothetical protein
MDKPPVAHPAHRRTKAEEADRSCATKTGQLNSLSTRYRQSLSTVIASAIDHRLVQVIPEIRETPTSWPGLASRFNLGNIIIALIA